jgi:hypothetical protein
MNARSRFVVLAAVVLGLTAGVALAATRHVALAFDATSLPYPDGTVITTQLVAHGVVFSANDSDLPPEYRLSLGPQENVVRRNGAEATLTNPFRIAFTQGPVMSATLTIEDRNLNDQRHTLTAFTSDGRAIDAASFQDGIQGDTAGTFTLSVSSKRKKDAIAYVVVIEQPFGAEILRAIDYTTKAKGERGD